MLEVFPDRRAPVWLARPIWTVTRNIRPFQIDGASQTDLDLPGWYRDGDGASDLRRRLHVRAAIDYGNDDIVEIAGCYMPVTELLLCALSVIS